MGLYVCDWRRIKRQMVGSVKPEVRRPRPAVTFRPFPLSDILTPSFMEISHFPSVHQEDGALSVSLKVTGEAALMLRRVFKAGRAQSGRRGRK